MVEAEDGIDALLALHIRYGGVRYPIDVLSTLDDTFEIGHEAASDDADCDCLRT